MRVGGELRKVVGTISMDSFAVELDRQLPVGTPVTLLGHGVLAEAHAKVAGTINYELVSRITSDPRRTTRRTVVTHEPRRRPPRAFARNAESFVAHTLAQVEPLREQLSVFLAPLRGDERVLDAGTGPGTLALALAPLVGEVVGVDFVPELFAETSKSAPANVRFEEGDVQALAFESESFDLACCPPHPAPRRPAGARGRRARRG